MTARRHLRVMEKMKAVKARKRLAAAAAGRAEETTAEVYVAVVSDSQKTVDHLAASEVSKSCDTDSLKSPESQVEQTEKTPLKGDPSTFADSRQHSSPGVFSPKAMERNSMSNLAKAKIMGPAMEDLKGKEDVPAKETPCEIATEKPCQMPYERDSNGMEIPRVSKKKLSNSTKNKTRVRNKEVPEDDDTASLDSANDGYLSVGKSNAVTHVLDQVFDLFSPMESMPSFDEESLLTERTDRTERTDSSELPDPSFGSFLKSVRPRDDLMKDMEEMFMERLGCALTTGDKNARDLGIASFSFTEEDESTTTDFNEGAHKKGEDSVERKREGKERSSAKVKPHVSSNAPPPNSSLGEVVVNHVISSDESRGNLEHVKSFDSSTMTGCSDGCNMVDDFFEPPKNTKPRKDMQTGIQDMLGNVKQRATNVGKEFKRDLSFHSVRSSIRDTSSVASTMFSSLRESVTATEDSTVITLRSGESIVTEDRTLTETASTDTQSIRMDANGIGENTVYAPGQEINRSESWFTVEKNTNKEESSPFGVLHATMAKFGKIDHAHATQVMQELQKALGKINLTSTERNTIVDQVRDTLNCTSKLEQTDFVRTETSEQTDIVRTPVLELNCRNQIEKALDEITEEPIEQSLDDLASIIMVEDADISIRSSQICHVSPAVNEQIEPEHDRVEEDNNDTAAWDETRSLESRETNNIAEDEADNPAVGSENGPQSPVSRYSRDVPVVYDVDTTTMTAKNKGKLGRSAWLVRPHFKRNKGETAHQSLKEATQCISRIESLHGAKDALNVSIDSDLRTENTHISSEQNSLALDYHLPSPMDPSVSTKTKREAWRSTKQEQVANASVAKMKDFDIIMTNTARDEGWDDMFSDLYTPIQDENTDQEANVQTEHDAFEVAATQSLVQNAGGGAIEPEAESSSPPVQQVMTSQHKREESESPMYSAASGSWERQNNWFSPPEEWQNFGNVEDALQAKDTATTASF